MWILGSFIYLRVFEFRTSGQFFGEFSIFSELRALEQLEFKKNCKFA